MMELSEMKSPSLSGPIGYFWHKSTFRLCLFLDIWIMSMDCRLLFMDDWSSWEK